MNGPDNIQEQINDIQRKLDTILESIEQQKQSREALDDLVADVGLVAKDAFGHAVVTLDKAQVELDHSHLSMLFIKFLQNIDTFYEMLEMMESARDFLKDATPILHQVGLDAIHKMNEFDRKGYFDILRNLSSPDVLDGFVRASRAMAEVKMDDRLDDRSLFALLREMNSPEVRKSLSYSLRLVKAMQTGKTA